VVAPLIALWLREPRFYEAELRYDSMIYVAISGVFTGLLFVWFRLSHSVSRFFSVDDALTVIKASLFAVVLTAVTGFLLTRLDNIPRSVPIIHFMVLAAGSIAGRAERYLRRRRRERLTLRAVPAENIVIVGVSDLSWFYIQMIEELAFDTFHVVALVDDAPSLQGRFVQGYPIAGRIRDLDQIVDEYAIHGVEVHRIVLAADPGTLEKDAADLVFAAAKSRNIQIEVLPERLGLARREAPAMESEEADAAAPEPELDQGFWRMKRWFDLLVASALLIVTAPLALVIAVLVLLDCGMPVIFWQVRIGRNRQRITVYKFRTLHAPYGRGGAAIAPEDRLSWVGRILRWTHLDELPQLLSVIVGDMSLIGPRPLLPIDLAKSGGLRFTARPGITGWAQINGATQLTSEEKSAMDEWYIRHASSRLDLAILAKTVLGLVMPARRNEQAIRAALEEERGLAGETALEPCGRASASRR
jgi:lipopolysaccharide/colanic/teichoic acid biosynthesis glycosyltransferase